MSHLDRRGFLARSGAVAIIAVLPVAPAAATPEALQEAIREVVGSNKLNPGKVTLDLPPLVENGNTVPMRVAVDSPMTEADHVKAIYVFNERNPQPHVIEAHLGPRAGRAAISAHIKLADSQRVVAIAALSDGSFWTAAADVIVTIAACTEDIG
jgi:sulfur-oxidizing protein SoxY